MLTIEEFAAKVGLKKEGVRWNLSKGKIQGAKNVKSDGRIYGRWEIPESAVESFLNRPKYGKRTAGPALPGMEAVGVKANKRIKTFMGQPIPAIETDVDVDFMSLSNFKPERGKYPYKNLCMAVKMAIERKSWEEIFNGSGVPRTVVLPLIEEFRMAGNAEPKKYKSLMSYLNDGRPYHPAKRNMLKKAKK